MSVAAALRAAPTLLRVGFAAALAYRAEFIIWMFSTNMPLVMLAMWSSVARNGPVGSYSQDGFAAYYLSTLLVRLLTGVWVVYEITMEVRQGTLGMRLLRPVGPIWSYLADHLSAIPMRGVIALPLLAVLLWSARGELTQDPLLWALVPFSVLFGFLIVFFLMCAIGALAFFLESAIGLAQLYLGLSAVLSGYLVPLDLFPPGVRSVALALPFRFTLSYPVELMLGRLGRADALWLLAAQVAWMAFSYALFRVLWTAGLRRFGAYGG